MSDYRDCQIIQCFLVQSNMVTVPHNMVGLERMLDYRGVGLQRFHCIIRYEGKNSSRYDGKQFYELSLRVRRINGSEDRGVSSFAFIHSSIIVIASAVSLKRRPDPSNLLSVPCALYLQTTFQIVCLESQILPAAEYVRAVQKRPCADSIIELCAASRNS